MTTKKKPKCLNILTPFIVHDPRRPFSRILSQIE